ncbi:MAG: hypothetical protein OSA48_06400 [Akkermansiaceae bacterium]|nr:hypothetical protein [Akkermansiaceae bacterium]
MTRFPRILLAILSVGILPATAEPQVVTPTAPPPNPKDYRRIAYPWKKDITATVFWIGEKPGGRNNTSNHHSSWDREWQKNFGGYDNPDPAARTGFRPTNFVPKLNPFYIALPYNDCLNHAAHKSEAAAAIPWFHRYSPRPGQSVCKGRWIQIISGNRTCYAQWEDCGPWVTDDWQYVFGNRPPRNTQNSKAGIDVSPAVRDQLGIKSGSKIHWRFVELSNVPRGPWSQLGTNNPFVNPKVNPDLLAAQRYNTYLRELRDKAYQQKDTSRSR